MDGENDDISIMVDFTGGLQKKNIKLNCKCSRSQLVCDEYHTKISVFFKLEYLNNNVLNGQFYMNQQQEYVSHSEVLFGKPRIVEYDNKEKKCFIIVEPNRRLNKEKKEYSTLSPHIWNQLFIQLKKRLDFINSILWDVFCDLLNNCGDDADSDQTENGIDYLMIMDHLAFT